MNKYFLIFGIIAVMLLVGFTGCLGNDDNGNDEELVPTASLKLQTKDELNTRDQNQDLAMLSHRSGDNIIWSDEYYLYDVYGSVGPVQAPVGVQGKVTVYILAYARYAVKFNDAYFDDAVLALQQP